jgi:addiction module HigA family antidote
MTYWLRLAIDWKNCEAIGRANTAFASTINGESAFDGKTVTLSMSRLSIIIREAYDMEERLPPIHPGEVLLEDFMKPLGLSQYRLAKDIGVPALRINQIVHGKRSITADTAMRLARYFGTSPDVWLRLQARYDLEKAQRAYGDKIEEEVKVLRARQTVHVAQNI